jgi:hypothetical protein
MVMVQDQYGNVTDQPDEVMPPQGAMSRGGSPPYSFISPNYTIVNQPSDFTSKRFTLADELEDLHHMLSGDCWEAERRCWTNDGSIRPLMNKAGVQYALQYYKSHVNPKVMSLGNIDAVEFNAFMMRFCQELNNHLFYHEEDYNLREEDEGMIIAFMENSVKMVLSGSKDGFQTSLLQTNISNMSSMNEQKETQVKAPGLFNKVAGVLNWK